MATPNMNLTLPTVGATAGPTYAQQNNAALEAIDEHDHTSGNGVQVPSAGININANLDFNGYSPTGLESAVFDDVAGTPAVRSVYVDGGELYFKDASGNAVQLTANGSISGTPGSISNLGDGGSSAVFSDLAEDFSWYFSGTKLAAMNMGDLRLFPFDGSATYSNFITLKAPTALASNFSLTLPTALPANTNFVQVSSAGTLSFSNTITQPILGANGTAGAPTYAFSGDSGNGMWLAGSDTLGFTINGTNRASLSATALTSDVPVRLGAGSVTAPSFSFSSDSNTGIYSTGDGILDFTTNGTNRLSISTSISTNNTAFSTGTGAITGGSINLSSGGAFKAQIYSGSLAAGANTILTVSGTVNGATGFAQGSGSVWNVITNTDDINFGTVGSNTDRINLYNSGISTRSYRVIIFYS